MDLVYLETSIISHATALPSRHPQTAVLQEQSRRWMVELAPKYSLVTSAIVVNEVRRGDATAAARRLEMLRNIRILEENPDTEEVARQLTSRSMIPEKARVDALHVATAALAGVQYMLTVNCRHIANAMILPRVYKVLEDLGLPGMLIVTPVQFMGEYYDA